MAATALILEVDGKPKRPAIVPERLRDAVLRVVRDAVRRFDERVADGIGPWRAGATEFSIAVGGPFATGIPFWFDPSADFDAGHGQHCVELAIAMSRPALEGEIAHAGYRLVERGLPPPARPRAGCTCGGCVYLAWLAKPIAAPGFHSTVLGVICGGFASLVARDGAPVMMLEAQLESRKRARLDLGLDWCRVPARAQVGTNRSEGVCVDPDDPETVWIPTPRRGGAYDLSVSRDGGKTFTAIAEPGLNVHRSVVALPGGIVCAFGQLGRGFGVTRSSDGGKTFHATAVPGGEGGRAEALPIVIDAEGNPLVPFIGYSGARGGVLFSSDAGASWRPYATELGSIVPHPTKAGTVWLLTSGGIGTLYEIAPTRATPRG